MKKDSVKIRGGDDKVTYFLIFLGIALFLVALSIAVAFICYRIAFYVPPRKAGEMVKAFLPDDEIYGPFKEKVNYWIEKTAQMPFDECEIISFDGLKLYGKYYEYQKGAEMEIMFHGYRGSAERDLAGGVERCHKLGRNALIVDQRCGGKSDGTTITFGINESKDCIKWIDFAIDRFGKDVKIILTGISMGAATVLIAAGEKLPSNVIGVLADCGYNSAKDIIKKEVKKMGLPVSLGYFFVKLGAKIFGQFNLEETSPEQALKNCLLPVIFFHGDSDDFVPCEMSKINYNVCKSKKKLVIIKNAGHGLGYPTAPAEYLQAMKEFFKKGE